MFLRVKRHITWCWYKRAENRGPQSCCVLRRAAHLHVRRSEGMSADFPQADWKAFRRLREVALERFCDRILGEVNHILSEGGKSAHARYLAAFECIQDRDDKIARAFNNPRRSAALAQLATMLSLNIISHDELQSFTPRTRSVLEMLRPQTRKGRAKSA